MVNVMGHAMAMEGMGIATGKGAAGTRQATTGANGINRGEPR